ncbi:MAG TPA: glycosyltransferase family 1 protein, partial [Rhodobacteraceae bacterium]|nr:glycosyltransferase family 1 protein [Paracoccaceae bacterium]
MHIIFFNPQGNFDAADSHLTEHADFGGQLVYVKEVAMAMARQGHRIDIITRRIEDPDWPEFAAPVDHYPGFEDNLRIIRLDCGGPLFLEKEQLWPHLDEFVSNCMAFYGDDLPDFATAHYADGGYCAALFMARTGIGFTLTGHSLGAQKLDKLGANVNNWDRMEKRFRFSHRIAAERLAMERAFRIITSTAQEWQEQYAHPLYKGAVDVNEPGKFSVIPPGVNTAIFTTKAGPGDAAVRQKLEKKLPRITRPSLLVSSRLDEKKNILGVVRAYAGSPELQEKSDLVLCIRGIENLFAGKNDQFLDFFAYGKARFAA